MAVGGRVLTREPHRTCAGCRAVDRKAALVRVTGSTGPGAAGTMPAGGALRVGRGAYVHPRAACAEAALRGGLARSLRRQITDTERAAVAQAAGLSHAWPSHLAAGHDPTKAVETLPRPEVPEAKE